jgi:hypothetical protein
LKPRRAGGILVSLGGAKGGRIAVDQDIAHVGALADRAKGEARRQFGRQVFQTMHCQVGPVLEQRDLQLLREKPLGQARAFLREGSGLELVPGGLDDL